MNTVSLIDRVATDPETRAGERHESGPPTTRASKASGRARLGLKPEAGP